MATIDLKMYSGSLEELKIEIEHAIANGYDQYDCWATKGLYDDVEGVYLELGRKH